MSRAAALSLALAAFSLPAAASPRATLDRSSVPQGEMTLCHVDAGAPCEDISAQLDGRKLPAIPANDLPHCGQFTILVPADLAMHPGAYSVQIEGHTAKGRAFRTDTTLSVKDGQYPVERLTVQPSMVNPKKTDLARIQKEEALMESLFRLRTARQFHGPFMLPVDGEVTSSFGRHRLFNGQPRSPHSGTDIRATTGTPIVAPAPGTVCCVHSFYFLGNAVVLDHGLGVLTFYGHMSSVAVHEGQTVRAGDLIGKVGQTGRVTGPHLHWASRVAGARINPVVLTKLALPR